MESGANKSKLGETAKIGLEVSGIGGDACRCCPEFPGRRHVGVMSPIAHFYPLITLGCSFVLFVTISVSVITLLLIVTKVKHPKPQSATFFLNDQSTS